MLNALLGAGDRSCYQPRLDSHRSKAGTYRQRLARESDPGDVRRRSARNLGWRWGRDRSSIWPRLKNISPERYEAADIDGANWMQKIRYITLPGLKPLIMINLLGVFIGGFKAMENIFILTQGGPLNATRTIGLEVWQNAFMYLKFGYATAAAWVMGSILIGFTLIKFGTWCE